MLNIGLQFFAMKHGQEIPTIDVCLVTISTDDGVNEIGLETANKISVSPQVNTKDAIQLVVKGKLLAQKPAQSTITGHTIVLTDNVFIPEVAVILQGGKITYKSGSTGPISKYEPSVAGSGEKGKVFKLNAYSAIYNEAGIITGYEKISYPNCQGTPFGLSSEDDVFRVSEYTINSAPAKGEAPYTLEYIDELPTFE